MTIFGAVGSAIRNYADFSGRASRSEFWLFQLAEIFLAVVTYGILNALAAQQTEANPWPISVVAVLVAYGAAVIFLFIPNWSVTVRRLHDAGLSGFWILIQFVPSIGSLVLLVLLVLPSTGRGAARSRSGGYANATGDTRFATGGGDRFGANAGNYGARPTAPSQLTPSQLTPSQLTPSQLTPSPLEAAGWQAPAPAEYQPPVTNSEFGAPAVVLPPAAAAALPVPVPVPVPVATPGTSPSDFRARGTFQPAAAADDDDTLTPPPATPGRFEPQ